MRFYTNTHYCGIDLHAKTMHLCILDRDGQILLHKNMRSPEGQKQLRRLAGRHGKAKALSILAAKLGRAVYLMLTKERAFNMQRFLAHNN